MTDRYTDLRAALYAAITAGLVAATSWYIYYALPRDWHAAIVGTSAALIAVLSAVSGHLFGKFDKLLSDSERFDVSRVRRIAAYVHRVRRRLVVFLFAAAVFGVANAGVAVLLAKPTALSSDAARTFATFGYFGYTCIILFAIRIASAYLSIDVFRVELFASIQQEIAREMALAELRPSTIAPFASQGDRPSTPPMQARAAAG